MINYTDDAVLAYTSGTGRSGRGGFWGPPQPLDHPETFEAVDADVLVDGMPLAFPDGSNGMLAGPTPGAPPIPWDIGRVRAGALIDITVRSTTPHGLPFAGIGVSPFQAGDICKGPGCVAHGEHPLDEYCDQ